MPNEATGHSPSMLLFGYELKTPGTWPVPRLDFVEGEIEDEIGNRVKAITQLNQELRPMARERAQEKKERDCEQYDRTVGF